MGRTFYSTRKRIDKLSNDEKLDLFLDLIYSFSIIRKTNETAIFLQDLLTTNEVRNLSVRLRIAKLLLAGYTYQEIIDTLHVSNSTVYKVSVWLEQGGDGFKNVISKLPIKWEKPKKLPPGPIEFHLPALLAALVEYKMSERGMKTVRKFSSNLEEKKLIDKSISEANKYLYMDGKGKVSK